MRRAVGLAALLALAAPDSAAAHGIGGVKDLPVPGWLFLFGGAVVLVVSFSALGVLWTTPKLEDEHGKPLPVWAQRILLSRMLRVVLGTFSFGLFVLVWVAAAFGSEQPNENLAPTFVYVAFWLGVVPLVVLFGNVWAVLDPWRAAADAVAWIGRRAGFRRTTNAYPEWLGRWPAAFLLLSFATLELVYVEPANPRVLAQATTIYSLVTWGGMLAFGRRDWRENGDGFAVYYGLLSRLSAFAMRERDARRELIVRRPLSPLATTESRPGTVAFVAVMLGSVAFDGFSRSTWWQDRLFSVRAPLVESDPELADLLTMGFSLLGLVCAVLFVALAYLVAVAGAQAVAGREVSFEGVFVCSLIPIALVYVLAHYFSLFVIQGQYAIPLLSDPLGKGWDVIGTADYRPRLALLSPNMVWYVQVGVLVTGHLLALVIAHDRALALVRSAATAARTQYAMLALMVLFTVGGMWLLSLG
jgi:hypothetical protein